MAWFKKAPTGPTPVTFERVMAALTAIGYSISRPGDDPWGGAIFDDVGVSFAFTEPWLKIQTIEDDNLDPAAWPAVAKLCNEWNATHSYGVAFPYTDEDGLQVRLDFLTFCLDGLTEEQLESVLKGGIGMGVTGYQELHEQLAALPRK